METKAHRNAKPLVDAEELDNGLGHPKRRRCLQRG
jgi:hypothetical protein